MRENAPLQAESWFLRLAAPDCTAEERETFERWRVADPAHANAYADVARMWTAVGAIGERPAIQTALAETLARTDTAPSRRRLWMRAAAILATMILIGMSILVGRGDPEYRTAVGEQKTIALDDGSRLTLDTATLVRVHFEP